jgi:hypothetical protein
MYLLADEEIFGGGGGGGSLPLVNVPATPILPSPVAPIPLAASTLPGAESSIASTITTLGNLATGLIQSTTETPKASVPFIQTQTTNTTMLDKIKTYINNNALTCVIVALVAGVAGGIYYKSKKRR